MYPPFEVGTDDDLFVSPERFLQVTGREFADENEDGICDYFQDGPRFRELGLGSWTDANGDGIGDLFQTREMYWAMGLNNFVDVDGDGLCDNYEQTPFAVRRRAAPAFRAAGNVAPVQLAGKERPCGILGPG